MQYIKYFILQGGTDFLTCKEMNFESLELHTTFTRAEKNTANRKAYVPAPSPRKSTRTWPLAQHGRQIWFYLHWHKGPGRESTLCTTPLYPGKGEKKKVGNGKYCTILRLENQGKSRLNYLLRAASQLQVELLVEDPS